MTLLEPAPAELELDLPPGIRLQDEALRGVGNIAMIAGQVLVGELDPETVNSYAFNSVEARAIARAICDINTGLRSNQRLVFGPVPGDDKKVGLWVSPAEDKF